MLAVLLFGPPGAGKGTQAAAVAAASGVPHIATGDMFREHLRSDSELGRLARSYMDRGELVPDDVTIGMLGRAHRRSRTRPAASCWTGSRAHSTRPAALDRLLAERGARVSGVLDIEVHGDELVRRLAGRLVCRESSHPYHVTDAPPAVPGVCDIDGSELYHRDDDREDVIRNRVAVFEQETRPVREHYRALGTPIVTIDGARDRAEVEADLVQAVRGLEQLVILRKSRRELERMAAAGSVVARTLALLRDRARPGVTTGELDRAAEAFIRDQGGVPTFKGYHGFPASICASPNDMVVHGIPGAYALPQGDVLSVDVGVTLRGWVADSGYTFWVGEGEPPEEVRRLLTACRASLFAAVEQCVDGHHLSDLGHAVQTRVEADGFGVIRSLVGHGVGRRMHEDPQIPNYGRRGGARCCAPA